MNNSDSLSPAFIVLSSDPPTPIKAAVSDKRPHMSTGGQPRRRPKTPLDAGYEWSAIRIIKKSTEHYLIDFSPTALTTAEYDFWALREEFASEQPINAEGRILVTFWPSWQLHYDASVELVNDWEMRRWEEVFIAPEDL
ncbi:hypothetical protein P7C70_g7789, partial [Phenoliferia sp. Uapishka_3]